MKFVLLASDPDLYSHQRLLEAAEERDHAMHFIHIRECYMNISASKPQVHYQGEELFGEIDAVIPRIRPSATFYGTAVLRQFEMMGIYCVNGSVAIARSRDKLRCLQLLSREGIDMPITGFADSPEDTKAVIKMVGGAPLIVKLLEGTQGVGVVLAETNKAAESVINAFKCLKAHILVQEFIREAGGKDIRCFVVGRQVIAAMERTAAPGEFRANIHQGGIGAPIVITAKERAIALKAARVMHLDVAGVDLVRSKTGPKILEINSSPGFEGIEKATGVDIAGAIIRWTEQRVEKSRAHKRRGKTTA